MITDPLIDLYWHFRLLISDKLKEVKQLKLILKNLIVILSRFSTIIKKTQKTLDKVVSIKIKGGLGNQLFQIAFVLAYGWKYSITPQIKKVRFSPSRVDPRPVYWDTLFRNVPVKNFIPPNLAFYQEKNLAYYEIPKPETILNRKNYNGILFNGYYQSENHFDEFRRKILPILFYIDPVEKKMLINKYPEIFKLNEITISIHIRRGDNVTHAKKYGRPYLWVSDYYQKSTAFFEEKFGLDNIRFVVISTDPNWSKDFMEREFPRFKASFPSEKDYLELYVMSCCKHQIIASSTFSLWGAYLNKNPEKIVISPKNWHDPRRVPHWEWRYMENWIKF